MQLITKWVLPVAMMAIGIAVFTGVLLPNLPVMAGLRMMIGLVAVLLGVHRFVASRIVRQEPRRRFGGERSRPWEDRKNEEN